MRRVLRRPAQSAPAANGFALTPEQARRLRETAYERGVGLLRQCYGQLKDAEQRVKMLAGLGEDGRPDLQPFEHTSSHEPAKVESRKPL